MLITRVSCMLLNHISQYNSIQIAYHETDISQVMKSSNSQQFNYTNPVQ